jgi:aminopeptidase
MIKDPRIDRLAFILLHHSLDLAKGDIFQVSASIAAKPLVEAIFREASAMGVFPIIRWQDDEIGRLGYDLLTPGQSETERFLELNNRWEMTRWQDIAANLTLRGLENDQEISQVPREKIQLTGRVGEALTRLIIDERKWALFYWPTPAQAQKAGLSTGDYFDFVLNVSLIDYDRLHVAEQDLARRMEAADQVRILGPDTDLTFSIRGMPAVCCYGRRNVPDGEVYTAPLRVSANGRITYNVPSTMWGQTFERISLEFEAGRIVHATCAGGAAALDKIFDTDEGARYIGEFSFGVNPLITRPTGSTLFDEKITGSLHLTPGNAYARANNGNQSQIHWDLIQIQRPEYGGGEIWLDGELVRKDGLFVPDELAGLNP